MNQLVARTDTRKHALVQSLVERQHAVELEKKLNGLHPADAAFVLESLRQEQRLTAWRLIRAERRGSILLELAAPIRSTLVALVEEPELVALGAQMEAEDFADLVQDLPKERVDAVLARLDTTDALEVQSVLSFPADSVGALMQLDTVTVRCRSDARERDHFAAPAAAACRRSSRRSGSSTATTCYAACCRSIGCS